MLILPLILWALVAVVFAVVAALWLVRVPIYLAIGAGYVLVYGTIGAGYVLFAGGWLIWQGCRGIDWTVGKCAPPIAARYHRWRASRAVTAPATQNRHPVRDADSEIVHYGYGHLNLARRRVRELPPRKSSALARR